VSCLHVQDTNTRQSRPPHRETRLAQQPRDPVGALRCRRKFLRIFPGGFRDQSYLAWERDYKWEAHERWTELLGRTTYEALLREGKFAEIAARAVAVEARTNLIFSFEKMAVRDAVKSEDGARSYARGLYEFLYGPGPLAQRFDSWRKAVGGLARVRTRVSTWPIATVFGFHRPA
jgi:hypothetical protein